MATEVSDGEEPETMAFKGAEPAFSEWSDEALFAAVVARSGDAYAEVCRRYSPAVGSASRMVLGHSPACEDIVAEVFVRFWLTPQRFDPERGSLLGFLRLNARNRSIDVLRSEMKRRRREYEEANNPASSVADAGSTVVVAEASVALHQAVAALPVKEREAIRLAFFHGMSYQAVALHLGEPEGTVKSRIKSGLLRLRRNHDVRARSSGGVVDYS